MTKKRGKTNYKPDGYNSASPYLVVNGADNTIEFLIHVFGAKEVRRFATPDGTVGHAEVQIDDTIIMLASSVENWPAIPAHVHVYVEDVDSTFARAVAAGATAIREPVQNEGETDKRGGVRGPGGIVWWMATMVD